MEALGLQVTRLIRTDYGPFSLGNTPRGEVVEVKPQILRRKIPGFYKNGTKP